MKKTGGKMNAACMFWDKSGNKTLSWHPLTGRWDAISTEGEFERAREFTSIYNDEIRRLKAQYGDEGKGRISMRQIHDDLRDEPISASGTGSQLNVRGYWNEVSKMPINISGSNNLSPFKSINTNSKQYKATARDSLSSVMKTYSSSYCAGRLRFRTEQQ